MSLGCFLKDTLNVWPGCYNALVPRDFIHIILPVTLETTTNNKLNLTSRNVRFMYWDLHDFPMCKLSSSPPTACHSKCVLSSHLLHVDEWWETELKGGFESLSNVFLEQLFNQNGKSFRSSYHKLNTTAGVEKKYHRSVAVITNDSPASSVWRTNKAVSF